VNLRIFAFICGVYFPVLTLIGLSQPPPPPPLPLPPSMPAMPIQPAIKTPPPISTATVVPQTFQSVTSANATAVTNAAPDSSSGTAKGSLMFDNSTAALIYAAAFIDQKDERKPIVLILSDKKLPAENWTSDFDIMRDNSKFNGIVFFLDKEGKVYRTDVHMKDRQTGVSGIFDAKLDNPTSKDLTGNATGKSSSGTDKLDAAFHATLK
jgi:hypothetical protein